MPKRKAKTALETVDADAQPTPSTKQKAEAPATSSTAAAPSSASASASDGSADSKAATAADGGVGDAARVVRLRRSGGVVVQDCDVYIGRAMNQGGWRLKTSVWHNPYKVKDTKSRGGAVRQFEKYLLRSPQLLRTVATLHGKTLGCWCAPEQCHGDVLVRYAAMSEAERELLIRDAESKQQAADESAGAKSKGKKKAAVKRAK